MPYLDCDETGAGGRMLVISKLRLTQPSLAGSGAELGNNAVNSGHFVSVTAHATTRTKIYIDRHKCDEENHSYLYTPLQIIQ